MKRLIITFFLFFLLTQFSFAESEDRLEWFDDNELINIGEKSFNLEVSQNNIRVTHDQNSFILEKNNCFYLKEITFCLLNTTYDWEREIDKAYIDISKRDATIEDTIKITPGTITLGEKSTINIKLKNIGNIATQNFEYKITFPENFAEFERCEGCLIENNNIIYSHDISSDNTIDFSFEFTPIVSYSYNIVPEISYKINNKITEEYGSSISINPTQPLNIKITNDNQKPVLGEKTQLKINISNKYEENIQINNIFISFPDNLEVKNINNENVQTGVAVDFGSHKLSSDDDQFQSFKFNIIPKKNYQTEIFIDIYYTRNEIDYEYTNIMTSFDITDTKPIVESNIDSKTKFDSNTQGYFEIELANENEKIPLKNISLELKSNIFKKNFSLFFKEQDKGVSKNLFSEYIKIPKINQTLDSYLTYNITSYDIYGNEYNNDKKINFQIIIPNPIKITKSGCTSKLSFGESCEMIIKAKNNFEGDIDNIYVYETFDNDKVIKEGSFYSKFSLYEDEEKTAYNYFIMYPKKEEDFINKTNLTTHISYSYAGKDYKDNITKTINFAKSSSEDKDYKIKLSSSKNNNDFYIGNRYTIYLTAENKGEDPIYNLRFYIEGNENIENIDHRLIFHEKLNPGELITYPFYFKSKMNKTIEIQPILLYNDPFGYEHKEKFNEDKINFKYKKLIGPIIISKLRLKDKNKNISLGDLLDVEMIIKNKGSDSATIEYYSINNEKKIITLYPESSVIANDYFLINSFGNITIPAIKGNYSYAKKMYYFISNTLDIENKKPVQKKEDVKNETKKEEQKTNINKQKVTQNITKQINETINVDNTTDIINETIKDDKKEEKTSIIQTIKDKIGSIISKIKRSLGLDGFDAKKILNNT